jgi:hypothetical protein
MFLGIQDLHQDPFVTNTDPALDLAPDNFVLEACKGSIWISRICNIFVTAP